MSDEVRRDRSAEWFGKNDKDGFVHRSWMRNQGIPSYAFDGRPVVGICNTWSELTPCNAHFRTLAEHVKRGVLSEHVLQADKGVDFDFLVGCRGSAVPRESHRLAASGFGWGTRKLRRNSNPLIFNKFLEILHRRAWLIVTAFRGRAL